MKRVSISDLHDHYSLRESSKSAWVAFGTGLAGAVVCVAVFFLTDRFLRDVTRMADDANRRIFELTLEEREQIDEAIKERTLRFSRLGGPLFLAANILWIIGGYAWINDLKRNPVNRWVWRLGGLLVLLTAVACGIAWFLLIRLVQ